MNITTQQILRSIVFAVLTIMMGSITTYGQQCPIDPKVADGTINPDPLLPGQNGEIYFTYEHDGPDYGQFADRPLTISVCMGDIAPVNGAASVRGTYAHKFAWTWYPDLQCFVAVQQAVLEEGDFGTIIIDIEQVNPSICPDRDMGFQTNIQPAPCMNGTNRTDNDFTGFVTCTTEAPTPSISINDVTVNEDAGTATLQVCANTTVSSNVSIDYQTINGSAVSSTDYSHTTGTVTIPTGQQCVDVTIPITDDNTNESTEQFVVQLTNPQGGSIADSQGTVTILDNDVACEAEAPVLSKN